ncbi:MAG: MGMT family protein [Candidatus Bathyarchaeia archaeon]
MIHVSSGTRHRVWFTVAVNERGRLVACAFSDRSRKAAEKVVKETIRVDCSIGNDSLARRKLHELYTMYSGSGKTDFNSLDLSGISNFRRRVYVQLCRIPRGKVTTYGAIAKRLGSRKWSRAVGTAVATNPLPLAIPCHRVVPSTLNVGNYGTPGGKPSEGAYMKHGLLKREGVQFQSTRISKECLWSPD